MENSEKKVEEKKDKLKRWLKEPGNLILVLILIGAFAIRLYYLLHAGNQTLWWDEAEYMSTAKHWAFSVPYDINQQRPPLFQLLSSLLLILGFHELFLKFLLVALPSTAIIYLTYLLGKELFDKKTGLFAAAASVTMWSYLFWSARFQPDFLSLSFQLLSLFFFWKLFKNPDKKYATLAGVFAALGFYFKISALLVPLSVFVFAFFKDGFSFIKNKLYWRSFLAFIITLIPFMLWQYFIFGNPIAFASSYGLEGGSAERPFGWMALSFFYQLPKLLFFILFLIGSISALWKLSLTWDILKKEKIKRLNPDIFSLVVLAAVSVFYIFYIQGVIEDRWVFLIMPFVFFFSAKGLFNIFSSIKLDVKGVKAFIILVVFALFFYFQIQHSSSLIENKIQSYAPVKESALWIKSHSDSSDKVVSASYTQMTSYSERRTYAFTWYKNEEEFTKFLKKEKPRYLMFSVWEASNHPQWAFQFGQQEGITIVSIPYLNSSIYINQQGQADLSNFKTSIEREGIKFTMVYPELETQLSGLAFVYETNYNE
ncbi:glycosyltransferase family 39 protein [Candidatus Pacearchaeota archaeon]|nr:glycosyltransferase family 39 protein [Candidatus Pacearchaeota archaeon]